MSNSPRNSQSNSTSTTKTLRQWLLLRLIASDDDSATIKHLGAETGVSDKTIRRDVAELQRAGFAIVERVGRYGRKTFALDAPNLPPIVFTYDEALALHICRGAITPLTGTFFWSSATQAFSKVQASLSKRSRSYVERMVKRVGHTSFAGNYAEKAELLDQILIGLEDSRAVFITYRSQRATEPVTLDIFPYALVEHHGALYIIGYSPSHDELRTWKLDRVLDAEVTNVPFQRPQDFDVETFLAGSFGIHHGRDNILVTVRVRFSPTAARYVTEKRKHASQRIQQQRDGSVIAEWRVSNTTEVKSYVLSFGCAAEVLEPRALRDEIKAEIERLATMYATSAEDVKNRAPRRPVARQTRGPR